MELYQQSLEISRKIDDRNSEAIAWFNLGRSLEYVNRKSDAMCAYRNALELYQVKELDADVQDCNNSIERLSQLKAPVVSHHGFWMWLYRFDCLW